MSEFIKTNKFGVLIGVFCLLLLAIFWISEGTAADNGAYKQYLKNGTINWANYSVFAQANAPLPRMGMKWNKAKKIATRRALIRSRYKLLQTIKNLQVQKGLFLREYFQNHQELASVIRGEIHNSEIAEKGLKNKDRIRVTTRIKLNSSLAKQIIPSGVWFTDANSRSQDSELKTVQHTSVQSNYTGIIVNAQNVPAQPALIFRLFDEKGRIVYGPGIVDRHIAFQRKMAIYATDKDFVPASRVGQNPLTVRAIRVSEDFSCDLVLPQAKADALKKIHNSTNLLNKARVAIILTRDSGQGLVEYDLD